MQNMLWGNGSQHMNKPISFFLTIIHVIFMLRHCNIATPHSISLNAIPIIIWFLKKDKTQNCWILLWLVEINALVPKMEMSDLSQLGWYPYWWRRMNVTVWQICANCLLNYEVSCSIYPTIFILQFFTMPGTTNNYRCFCPWKSWTFYLVIYSFQHQPIFTSFII